VKGNSYGHARKSRGGRCGVGWSVGEVVVGCFVAFFGACFGSPVVVRFGSSGSVWMTFLWGLCVAINEVCWVVLKSIFDWCGSFGAGACFVDACGCCGATIGWVCCGVLGERGGFNGMLSKGEGSSASLYRARLFGVFRSCKGGEFGGFFVGMGGLGFFGWTK